MRPLSPLYNVVAAGCAVGAWITLVVTGLRGSDSIGYGLAAFLLYGTAISSIDVAVRTWLAPAAWVDAGELARTVAGRRPGAGSRWGAPAGRVWSVLLRNRTGTRLYLLPVLTGVPVFVVGCLYDAVADPADLANAVPGMAILLAAALLLCLLGQIASWLVVTPLVALGVLVSRGLRGWGVNPLLASMPLLLIGMVLFAIGTVLGGDQTVGPANEWRTLAIQVLNVVGLPQHHPPAGGQLAWLWVARASLALMLAAVVGVLWQGHRLRTPRQPEWVGEQYGPPDRAAACPDPQALAMIRERRGISPRRRGARWL